jgi:hypothetical protein
VREYARRGGKLRRREARDLVKIDVNKTSRVWDFLVQAGYLRIGVDQSQQQQQQQQQQQPMRTPPHLPRARHLLQLGHDYAIMAAGVALTETSMPTSRATMHRVHPPRLLTGTGTTPQSSWMHFSRQKQRHTHLPTTMPPRRQTTLGRERRTVTTR